jgi:hypothetical protein
VRRTPAAVAATFIAAGFAAWTTGVSRAHDDPCHAARTCPSDDHSYAWAGMSCTSDPRDRLPEDQLPVDHRGVRYWCHVVVDQGMTTPGGAPKPPSSGCGGDRPAVRTLSDPAAADVRPAATKTSLSVLASLRRPATFARRGSGAEKTRYLVRARLVSAALGSGGELVPVVGAGEHRIAAHFPAAACTGGASRELRSAMQNARTAVERACGAVRQGRSVRLRGAVTITGVGFFSTSRAEGNGFGLAPVLRFSTGACRR